METHSSDASRIPGQRRPTESQTQQSDFHFFLKIHQSMVMALELVTVGKKMSVCNVGHRMGQAGTSERSPKSVLSQSAREMSGIVF